MRIQHNIAAMNSYRNYFNNVSAVNKNLEKLSSGYKVNRAGDDAAGLAISEKMRAQITGLDAAQKNVKDGISLVKTAEGAMQEIQDMLNRMDYLATQSANGTYDNEVDRANLQKEVQNLKTEINRIADSANFNGIKLLDGSLDSGASKPVDSLLKTFAKDTNDKWIDPTDIDATTGKFTTSGITGAPASLSDGDLIKFSVDVKDEAGNVNRTEITLRAEVADTTNNTYNLLDENGRVMGTTTTTTKDKPDAADISNAIVKALKEHTDLDDTFKIEKDANNQVVFTAYAPGKTLEIVGVNVSTQTDKAANSGSGNAGSTSVGWIDMKVQIDQDATAGAEKITVGEDKTYAFNLQNVQVWDGKDKTLEDCILELDGHKFLFVKGAGANGLTVNNALVDKMTAAGVEGFVQLDDTKSAATDLTAANVKMMVEEMRQATGLDIVQGDSTTTAGKFVAGNTGTNDTSIRIKNDTGSKGVSGNGGLTLQIGDTSDKFNQMKVAIGDMHTKAMGTGTTTIDGKTVKVTKTVNDIDISNQEGAAEAIGVIKNAINYVSSIRGDLGAVQNRLDHTANNLSVMEENIQDAESTIRDTDVAEEMMSYTKNNILVQSAQAMLAQANQIPQGVLQLLG